MEKEKTKAGQGAVATHNGSPRENDWGEITEEEEEVDDNDDDGRRGDRGKVAGGYCTAGEVTIESDKAGDEELNFSFSVSHFAISTWCCVSASRFCFLISFTNFLKVSRAVWIAWFILFRISLCCEGMTDLSFSIDCNLLRFWSISSESSIRRCSCLVSSSCDDDDSDDDFICSCCAAGGFGSSSMSEWGRAETEDGAEEEGCCCWFMLGFKIAKTDGGRTACEDVAVDESNDWKSWISESVKFGSSFGLPRNDKT